MSNLWIRLVIIVFSAISIGAFLLLIRRPGFRWISIGVILFSMNVMILFIARSFNVKCIFGVPITPTFLNNWSLAIYAQITATVAIVGVMLARGH